MTATAPSPDATAALDGAQTPGDGVAPSWSDIVTASQSDIVTMSDVRFSWPTRAHPFSLSVSRFRLERGEKLLLVGPSGSGKSTFLSLVTGILSPGAGRIDILGQDLTLLSPSARDRFRVEHFGIIFQMFNLLPYGTVLDNVVLPLSFAASRRARVAEAGGARSEALRLLARLGLDAPGLAGARASGLSVGQQQRVAAARALIGRPEIVIADEPTSALDRDRQQAFLDLLFAETEAAGASLVMVSHDESLGGRFSRVVRLTDIAEVARGDAGGKARAT